jgi:probable HAF family extracellular repeat protein
VLGGNWSGASSINESGQVVGASQTKRSLSGHAFLWDAGKMIDLGTLPGEEASDASAINERGQIVGSSGPGGISDHAVLWTLKR